MIDAQTRLWPSFLDDEPLQAVFGALPQARLVGGCVRDAVAGVRVADIDLATPQPPHAVIAALAAAGLRAVPTGIAHGTITAISAGRGFEITTLRRDLQTDGRHAVVAFTDDWRQDAARRDFTFNAMSMTQDGAIFDYFGGIDDLRAGRVRFVGDPATRLAEDRLRVLRYFRFFARYAALWPDEEVRRALRDAAPDLANLSAERVWTELKRILAAPAPLPALTLMDSLGILSRLLPEAGSPERLAALIRSGAPADPILRFAGLLLPTALSPALRLRFSATDAAYLDALRQGPAPPQTATDDDLRRLLADTPPDILLARSWLAGAPDALRQRILAIPPPVFPLEGRDVLAQGCSPGPAIGATLVALRRRWLQSGCTANRATCLSWLQTAGLDANPSLERAGWRSRLPRR